MSTQSYDGRSLEDRLELVGSRSTLPKDFSTSKSIHVSRVPNSVTDEEFRNAFSGLEGLERAELVFNSGPLRDYKNTSSRGFGFLHFKDKESALAASKILEQEPVLIRGYETEINPSRSKSPTGDQESHALHISGLPLDIQYLEVSELLKSKSLGPKSIRFMTGRDLTFMGAINIAFDDIESATKARQALIGATLGGKDLREYDVKYGRSLWDDGPTTTLMIIGLQRDENTARKMRGVLESLDGLTRYKIIKDQRTRDYKGIAILNCESIPEAWRILEYLNRTYPAFRVAFVTDKREYEKKTLGRERQEFDRSRPTSYRKFDRDPSEARESNRGHE